MKALRSLLVALAGAAACTAALADRSRIDDDVDVVEAGDCELETSLERRRARGEPRERELTVQLGCGVGWGTELAVAVARLRSEGTHDHAVEVEGKTELVERRAGGIGWSLAYGSGAERAAMQRWRRGEHFVAIEATRELALTWLLEAKLGAARDHAARRDRMVWLLGVEHAVVRALEARFELAGDDRERPTAGAALRYLATEHSVVTLSFKTRGGPARERSLGLGVTFEF